MARARAVAAGVLGDPEQWQGQKAREETRRGRAGNVRR